LNFDSNPVIASEPAGERGNLIEIATAFGLAMTQLNYKFQIPNYKEF
jgi:hypothetical protein